MDGAEIFFLSQDNCNLDLQPKLSLRRQLMGLSPKYNDLGLGRDMTWYASPWGLPVNGLNWGGFVKGLYCYLFFFVFLFLVTYVSRPHLPSWSVMTEYSIERKKQEKEQKYDVVGPFGHSFYTSMSNNVCKVKKKKREVNWCCMRTGFYFQQHLQSYWWQNIPALMLFYIHYGNFSMMTRQSP